MKFKRRWINEIYAVFFQNDAHFDSFCRPIVFQLQQRIDQRFLLRRGRRIPGYRQKIDIASFPAVAAKGKRSMHIDPNQPSAKNFLIFQRYLI